MGLTVQSLVPILKAAAVKTNKINLDKFDFKNLADLEQLNTIITGAGNNAINPALENFIRVLTQKEIVTSIEMPFANHRNFNDNGVLQIRDIATVYKGDANVINAIVNAEANKNSARYERAVLDLANDDNWFTVTSTISFLKKYSTLQGAVDAANNEIKTRTDAIALNINLRIWEVINDYPWSENEKIYIGVLPQSNLEEKIAKGAAIYEAVESFGSKLMSKNGFRGFNQPDDNHLDEVTFLNKISSNQITIAIDSEYYTFVKLYRSTFLKENVQDTANIFTFGTVEQYNFDDLNLSNLTSTKLLLATDAKISWGLVDESGNTILNTAAQTLESNNFIRDAIMLKQASGAILVEEDAPVPPTAPIISAGEVTPTPDGGTFPLTVDFGGETPTVNSLTVDNGSVAPGAMTEGTATYTVSELETGQAAIATYTLTNTVDTATDIVNIPAIPKPPGKSKPKKSKPKESEAKESEAKESEAKESEAKESETNGPSLIVKDLLETTNFKSIDQSLMDNKFYKWAIVKENIDHKSLQEKIKNYDNKIFTEFKTRKNLSIAYAYLKVNQLI